MRIPSGVPSARKILMDVGFAAEAVNSGSFGDQPGAARE